TPVTAAGSSSPGKNTAAYGTRRLVLTVSTTAGSTASGRGAASRRCPSLVIAEYGSRRSPKTARSTIRCTASRTGARDTAAAAAATTAPTPAPPRVRPSTPAPNANTPTISSDITAYATVRDSSRSPSNQPCLSTAAARNRGNPIDSTNSSTQ